MTSETNDFAMDRRNLLAGGALVGAGLIMPRAATAAGRATAAGGDMAAIRKAAEAGKDASVKRLRSEEHV